MGGGKKCIFIYNVLLVIIILKFPYDVKFFSEVRLFLKAQSNYSVQFYRFKRFIVGHISFRQIIKENRQKK